MKVVASIDNAAFAQALAPAMPEFERQFGAAAIAAIRDNKVANY
jgi:hypothetical protein